MIRKPKLKRGSRNPFQYLLDEYVFFVQSFEVASPLSIEAVVQNLQAMGMPQPSGCMRLRSSRIVSNVNSNDVDRAFFNLDLEHYRSSRTGGGYSASAHAEGRVYLENGQTYLAGKVTVAGIHFWGSIFVAVVVVGLFGIFQSFVYSTWFLLLIMGLLALEWYQMYRDRNLLLKLIEDAATYEYDPHEQEKPKREDI